LYGGKVINNRGYSVSKTPGNLPSSAGAGAGLGTSGRIGASGGLGYTVRRAVPRSNGGGGIRSAVSGAIRSAGKSAGGSVSRSGGFSKPGSSSSSGGSKSSGAKATRTAKRKGGGGD
jgi:hypothetical protein